MKKLFVLIILLITVSGFAKDFTGIGYGPDDKTAKQEALADLASAIKVEVKSKIEMSSTSTNNNSERTIRKEIFTNTEIPVLGVLYDTLTHKNEIMATARLSSQTSLPMYSRALHNILRNILASLKNAESATEAEKYTIYTELLAYLNSYQNYATVAFMLGLKNITPAPVTEAEITQKIKLMEQRAVSLELGAKLLLKDMEINNTVLLPPTTESSNEITPFAAALAGIMTKRIKSGSNPRYKLYGTYVGGLDELVCTYTLADTYGNTIRKNVAVFDKSAYAGYRIEPYTANFDKLLHEGLALSSDFRIEVSTNKGSENLLFKKGEEVEILVKLNKAGYLYITGHVTKENENFSYLMELSEAKSNKKFIYFINGDMINKWVSLGRFEVSAPFGVESVQVIASNKDVTEHIPAYTYDNQTGLYTISDNPRTGVMKTRALKPKKSKKTLSAETVLMFTTFEE